MDTSVVNVKKLELPTFNFGNQKSPAKSIFEFWTLNQIAFCCPFLNTNLFATLARRDAAWQIVICKKSERQQNLTAASLDGVVYKIDASTPSLVLIKTQLIGIAAISELINYFWGYFSCMRFYYINVQINLYIVNHQLIQV